MQSSRSWSNGDIEGPSRIRVYFSRERYHLLHGRNCEAAPTIGGIPLDLTDLELETAARACRAFAYYEERQAAIKMENPTTRGLIENTAKRAAALAEILWRAEG